MSSAPTVTPDGTALPAANNQIDYTDVPPPELGQVTPICPGVHWLRMPLPGELNHINLWLLEHEDGFVLVDTGMAVDESRTAWEALERSLLKDRPLKLIVVTHLHPDHTGLAAWLQSRHHVPVWMSAKTEQQVANLVGLATETEIAFRRTYLSSHGLLDTQDLAAHTIGNRYRSIVSGVPNVSHQPVDGEQTLWNGTAWRWLEVGGHAAGHLCLHAPSLPVLISGDQILPTISPNVSLFEKHLDENPLGSYLRSLDRLSQLDPQTLVLPSHGRPFRGLRARAQGLGDHHRMQLGKLFNACVVPKTAYETLPVMFGRPLRGVHQLMGLGEAIAHLEYMAAAGQLERHVDEAGTVRFARVTASQAA